jgi:hypothetical protein
MNIDKDIIIDLLPLYFSQEASAATRTVVEAYFAEHPEFAATMRTAQHQPPQIPGTPRADSGAIAMTRLRQLLRWRAGLQAIAIGFSLAPFSFIFADGRLTWMMLRDAPGSAVIYGLTAIGAWIAFVVLSRRMNSA